jgi:3-methyladenine DNA glycosylase AlkD
MVSKIKNKSFVSTAFGRNKNEFLLRSSFVEIKKELKKLADPVRAKNSAWFFKTGKGEYGFGDKFLGITMPELRIVAKKYFSQISVADTVKFLQTNKYHEERMLALLILMFKYKEADKNKNKNETEKKKIFKAYLANTKFINNWDLVDVTCRDIIGAYLFYKDRAVLYKLAKSKNLWEKRISIVANFYFISKDDLDDTFKIAEILLKDSHDLIHKAVGWALREAGKHNKTRLVAFLNKFGPTMPRTMLRYAIEKFSPTKRKHFLAQI